MRTPTMTQVASLRSGTVHIAVNSAGAVACRPNGQTDGEWTDVRVNCRNCLRIVVEAERAAHQVAELLAKAIADAEWVDASAGGNPFQSVGTEDLERQVAADRKAVAGYLRWGQTAKAANFSYVLRVAELELAHRARVANVAQAHTEALAEHHNRGFQVLGTLQYAQEMHRRAEAVAKGRRTASEGPVAGQRAPYPVDDVNWLRCALSFRSVTERLAEKHATVAGILASSGTLTELELWELGMAAFDQQRNLDIIHARVVGECPGCYWDQADHRWAHRPSCPVHQHGAEPFITGEDIAEHWSPGWKERNSSAVRAAELCQDSAHDVFDDNEQGGTASHVTAHL